MQTIAEIKETALNAGLTKEFVRFFGGGDLRQKQAWLNASNYVFDPETDTVSVDVISFGDFSKFLPDWPQKPVQIPVPEPEPEPEPESEPESIEIESRFCIKTPFGTTVVASSYYLGFGEADCLQAELKTEPKIENFEHHTWGNWELVSFLECQNDRFQFLVPVNNDSHFFLRWLVQYEMATVEGNTSTGDIPCHKCSTHLKPWEILRLALVVDFPCLPTEFSVAAELDFYLAQSVFPDAPLGFNPIRGFASILPYRRIGEKLVVRAKGCGFSSGVEIPMTKPLDVDNDKIEARCGCGCKRELLPDALLPRDRAIAEELRSEFGAIKIEDELAAISASIDAVTAKWNQQFGSQLSIDFAA